MNTHHKWKACTIEEDIRESESSKGPKRERKSLARFESKTWKSVTGYLDRTSVITLGFFLYQESAKFGFPSCELKWFAGAYFGLNLFPVFPSNIGDDQDKADLEGRIAQAFLSEQQPLDQTHLENLICDIYEVELKSKLLFEHMANKETCRSFPQLILGFFLGRFILA